VLLLLGCLAPVRGALAIGGTYTIEGGTPHDQQQIRDALNASLFDWSLVPVAVVIHIEPGLRQSSAQPGNIWINPVDIKVGTYGWATVQHEYAHELDFALLDDATRARLLPLLGGLDWWDSTWLLLHAQRGCERFASTLAWSYWPVPENSLRPLWPSMESAAMAPLAFRVLLRDTLLALGVSAAASLPTTLPGDVPPPPAKPATKKSKAPHRPTKR
jgi:hypothetical protein